MESTLGLLIDMPEIGFFTAGAWEIAPPGLITGGALFYSGNEATKVGELGLKCIVMLEQGKYTRAWW